MKVLAHCLLLLAFVPPLGSVRAQRKSDGVDALAKQLKDANDKERRTAVQELAKLGTVPAWQLVVDALGDRSAMVADEAQLQLAGVADAKTLESVEGKKGLGASDAWVRVRVAEAIGRMRAAPPFASIVAALQDKDPDVRHAVAWSLERRARSAVESDVGEDVMTRAVLERMSTVDKDPGVRAAALVAAGASDKEQKNVAAGPLADKAPEVRVAALLDALVRPTASRFSAAQKLAADPSFAVRAQAVETLASCRTKAACALLVERLEKEPSLRVRWRIVDELQKLSGSDLELNVPFWKKWVDGLDDSWSPPATGEKRKPKEKLDTETTVFLGLPVLSERLSILVDFSGSLWEKRADGKTRKQVVDVELEKLLKQLAPATKFNVIPYTKAPLPWSKTLVPATKENVARALEAFVKCDAKGAGDVWSAIELALDDPEVDTLVILTDGAPSGGHRWNLELIESLLPEKVRFRKVAVDAVVVDAKKPIEEHWRRMCAATGGRVQTVDMQ